MQNKLVAWYELNHRVLPWRKNKNPYYIWISEIMLQQTRVDTVIPYFNHFIEVFPTVQDLADANEDQLYKVWQGLGYYSRVRNMQIAAKQIVNEYNGKFPEDDHLLIQLKGIGPYTSRAIASIAFNQHVSAIDGNALRIIARCYEIKENIQDIKTNKKITELSDKLIQNVDPGSYNQAIMDLGATICHPKNPDCLHCPINNECMSYKHHTVEQYPVNIKKVKIKKESYIAAIIHYKESVFLIKNSKGLLKNLYGVPQYSVNNIEEYISSFYQEYHLELNHPIYLGHVQHVFTHRIWDIEVYSLELNHDCSNLYKDLSLIPVSTCHMKILNKGV